MSFLRQFFIYGMGGAATRLAAVVLVPLYTRTLSVPEYGRLEVLLAIHALMIILAGLQLESSVARDFYEARNRGESAELAWSVVWLTAAGAMIISIVMGCAWKLGWLPGVLAPRTLILLFLLTFPAQMFGVQMVILRFAHRSIRFAVISFCDLAISAVFSVWFIIGLKSGIDGALAGMLVGKLTCVGLAWPATFGRFVRISVYGGVARRILAYGIPSIPAVLIGWIQNAGSRLLLAVALTLSDVAIGGVAIKVAAIYSFIVYSFRLAWEPFSIAKLQALDTDPQVYHRTLEWYVATMFLVAGVATLMSPQIVRVLAPPAYAKSGTIAVLFLMGQFWVGMTNVLVIGIHGARRTSLLLPVYGCGAALNIVILFVLAPYAGVAAAGMGFLAGTILSAYLARHYSNKHFKTGFTLRIMGWTSIASIGFVAAWYAVSLYLSPVRDSPAAAWGMFALGLALLLAALAIIAGKAFGPGRGSAMWTDAIGLLRRTGIAR
jgi:O-antigen/teichoic acid export membrane protein